MAGTATTSSPGRRIRRSASRRLTSGWLSSDGPVEVEQVEGQEGDRSPGRRRPGGRPAPSASARPSASTTHELAVEDGRARGDPDGRAGQLGQGRRPVDAVGIDDPHVAVARRVGRTDEHEGPRPAPPRLEQVVRPSRTPRAAGAAASAAGPAGRAGGPRSRRAGASAGRPWSCPMVRRGPAARLTATSQPVAAHPAAAAPTRPPEEPSPCHAHRAPRTSTACASRPTRSCRPTAAGPSSRSRPWRPATTATGRALWLVSTSDAADAPAPRQLTLGAKHDAHARFSPDGRTLAFLSDRRPVVEEEPKRGKDAKDREDTHPGPPPARSTARARRAA